MIKNRFFIDIEKENKWLNQVASEGFRLVDKSWFTYTFESCDNTNYSYHVEKRSLFDTRGNDDFTHFLSELDISLVTRQWGWYYFEQHTEGEPIKLYTDIESKIKYYRRMFPAFILIAFINISVISSHLIEPTGPWILNVSVSYVTNIVILLSVILTSIKYIGRILSLKKQLLLSRSN